MHKCRDNSNYLSPVLGLVRVCFISWLLLSVISHFDMVAEQVMKTFSWLWTQTRRTIKTETTITSSSGGSRRLKWNYHLKEVAEINMFAHDHRPNPRVPQPTSFDRMKPSFMEWSEEIITFLVVIDYQKFIPLLTAAASSKDVIQANVMFHGCLVISCQKHEEKGGG